MMFFKFWTQHQGLYPPFVFCYRPQWQGREPIEFLHTHLDRLLQQYSCNHTVIVGDLNKHLVARAFEESSQYMVSLTTPPFPPTSPALPLILFSDLPEGVVTCRPLGAVGSSDHLAGPQHNSRCWAERRPQEADKLAVGED
ncbi:hypothetical protein GWK47_054424 [Chionoecetes opilio]|uniref:Endonuclease/exonuclease/phosphatase domain-containing protein n=1 Tax=Chionoecetes opilio TaxID=41210 RepID=A0A8J4Y713_CHIOP|nr:hypothetical protein GWK47_054424 [Chionoecetes opilio]